MQSVMAAHMLKTKAILLFVCQLFSLHSIYFILDSNIPNFKDEGE